MVRKVASVHNKKRCPLALLTVVAGLFCAGSISPIPAGSQENSFADSSAIELLGQIASGLVAHNPDRMLRTFDLDKMADGQLFKQQVTSFFNQTEVIRVHFDQVQTSMESGKGITTVEVELEAEHGDDRIPPLHKQAQLRFVAEASGGRWKFTDVQPRAFFSIQP
jgi:hypothetical protein